MTRFLLSVEEGVDLVLWSIFNSLGGEIIVPKIPSIKIIDVAKIVAPKSKISVVGIRPGEKLHEQMISLEDSSTTYEYKDFYKILPILNNWSLDKNRIKNGKKVSEDFVYSSNKNSEWMEISRLKAWVQKYGKT